MKQLPSRVVSWLGLDPLAVRHFFEIADNQKVTSAQAAHYKELIGPAHPKLGRKFCGHAIV
jgi:hypothetical protein